jgi:hypothetical protein
MRRLANPPGPAAAWMIDAFQARLSQCPNHDVFKAFLNEIRPPEMPLAAE